jgi:hypothetical protein
MTPVLPSPTILFSGPNGPLRQHVTSLLRAWGLTSDETPDIGLLESSIDVVCPAESDVQGLDALAAVLEHDTAPERTAHVFVLSGHVDKLRSALEAVRGDRYFAIVAIVRDSISGEALARQLTYAARWLDALPPRVRLPREDTLPVPFPA